MKFTAKYIIDRMSSQSISILLETMLMHRCNMVGTFCAIFALWYFLVRKIWYYETQMDSTKVIFAREIIRQNTIT